MNEKNLENKIISLESEIKDLKKREVQREGLRQKILRFSIISSLLGISLFSFAAAISSLHIFNDGEIISAQKMNENFAYLDNKISQVSSSGTISENILSFASISLGSVDSGKLYVVNDSAEFLLPDIATIPVGFNIQFSVKESAQARLVLNGTDRFESSINEDLMILSPMSGGSGSGYFHILNTGSEWIIKVQSNGTRTEIESSKIYTAYSCSGKGGDTNTNCYLNSTAKDITLFGYTIVEDKVLQYSSPNWYPVNSGYYLINDPSNLLPGVAFTSFWDFNTSHLAQSGSFVYVSLTGFPASIGDIFNHNSSYYNHGGTNNLDYINSTVTTGMVDSFMSSGFRGSGCQGRLGQNWRFMTESEALTELINIGSEYWISPNTATANEYKYMDSAGTVVLTTIDTLMAYKNLVCVYDPI